MKHSKPLPPEKQKGLLIDTVRCVGCMACFMACKEINSLPNNDDTELNKDTFTVVKRIGGYYVRRLCMHCVNPACVSVCPVAALQKTPEGAVIYDAYRCIGCRYCMMACPFQVPTYEWHGMTPRVRKCFLCYHTRVVKGKPTACAEACPYGATVFGTRGQLLKIARKRILMHPKKYIPHIYGEKELGGTGTLFLAGVRFETFGFRTDFRNEPLPVLTWNVLNRLPDIVVMGGVMLAGVVWIINRRIELSRGQAPVQKVPQDEGSD
ncbi:MAG: 4Fe-4S dicluster domain-containing protein [bacterium]